MKHDGAAAGAYARQLKLGSTRRSVGQTTQDLTRAGFVRDRRDALSIAGSCLSPHTTGCHVHSPTEQARMHDATQ
ncbi:MAG: hypothetical protein RLZZ153_2200 [Pseudomonadota bacterium]